MSKKLLITGFEPFGGETINPSWEAVKLLPDIIGNFELYKLQIPVVFGKAADMVCKTADSIGAHAVLCVGQAGGRASVTPEKVAINLRSGTDNEGNSYEDADIISGAPAAYFSTLPVRKMAKSIQEAGIPSAVSYTAGTYVCNDTLYTLLHSYSGKDVPVGFIHIPYIPEQGKCNMPNLPLCDIASALIEAILAITQ